MLRRSCVALCLSLLTACGGAPSDEPHGASPSATSAGSTGVVREVKLEPASKAVLLDNPCHNATTAPRLTTNVLTYPPQVDVNVDPANARLSRKGIEYMASAGFQYKMVADGCAVIREVRLGDQVLSTVPGRAGSYSVQSTGDTRSTTLNVNVAFPRTIDGETQQVTLTVAHVNGVVGTSISFPLVHAENVQAAYALAPVTVSRAEMSNLFTKALYNYFGGAANSTYLTKKDGSRGYRIYDYDPSSFELNMDGNGVAFQFHFKASIPGCDPDVRAYGTFKLQATAGNPLSATWPVPPNASLNYPWYCSLTDFVPLLGEVTDYAYRFVQDYASSSIVGSLEKQISDSLPKTSSSTQAWFAGTAHLQNEVQVRLQLPVPSVGIAVPYDAFALGRVGTLLPVGDPVRLTASGLGMGDLLAAPHSPASDYAGPNGIPLTGTTDWAYPETLTRSATDLVWSAHNVGNLLGKSVNAGALPGTTLWSYRDGCAVVQRNGLYGNDVNRPVVFGVNDTAADAARVRGYVGSYGYHLRLHFVGDLETPSAGDNCHYFFTGTPIVIGSPIPVPPPAF